MDYKKLLFIVFLLVTFNGMSQKRQSEKVLDSLQKKDELRDASDNVHSYLKANVAIGNELLSVHNPVLNAMQSDKKLVFTPSIEYFNKSGFSLSFAGYLLKDSAKTNFYQYSLTPAYDYENGKTVNAGISFTRYFQSDTYDGYRSPIQNDLYAYINFKRPWLMPGLALGYSSGTSKDVNVVTVNLPALGLKTFSDTATTKLKEFILTGSLQHTFDFNALLTQKDYLDFTPEIMINAGTSKETITHKNIYSAKVQNRKRVRGTQTDVSSFQLQSVGLSLDLNYTIGKFAFSPQLYLDYYLPASTDNKFSQIFSINFSLLF